MPLTPLEASNRLNEQVTVEMLVRASKNRTARKSSSIRRETTMTPETWPWP